METKHLKHLSQDQLKDIVVRTFNAHQNHLKSIQDFKTGNPKDSIDDIKQRLAKTEGSFLLLSGFIAALREEYQLPELAYKK